MTIAAAKNFAAVFFLLYVFLGEYGFIFSRACARNHYIYYFFYGLIKRSYIKNDI